MKKRLALFFLFLSLFACKKKDSDISDDSTFAGRFNGYPASISTATPPGIGKASYIAFNSPISSSESVGSYTSSISGGSFAVSFRRQVTYAGTGAPSAGQFQGFFGTGDLPYFDGTSTDGMSIEYIDKNGITWNTERGDQTGSVFTITKSQASGANAKIESEFSCKLYDSNGNIINLTGGTFTGQFSPN